MRRRDAALLAHLDAMASRITAHLELILTRLDRIAADLAGLKIDRHQDES